MRAWLVCLLVATPLAAQEAPLFRAGTSLALVRFHVESKNRYVTDLQPSDIVLLEDGAPRPFTVFENAFLGRSSIPVEMTLLFDTSGSVTQEGLLDPLTIKQGLLDSLENVTIAVFSFDRDLRRYCAPTADFATLKAALERVPRWKTRPQAIKLQLPPKRRNIGDGGTWIYAAVAEAAREAAATAGNATRHLIVFSDGLDTTTSQPDDVAGSIRDLAIAVHPVILGHRRLLDQIAAEHEKMMGRSTPEASTYTLDRLEARERDVRKFVQLADLTGGHAYDPPEITLQVMQRVLGGVVGVIRTEYAVGFAPESGAAPRQHKLEVRLRDKDLGRVTGGVRVVVH